MGPITISTPSSSLQAKYLKNLCAALSGSRALSFLRKRSIRELEYASGRAKTAEGGGINGATVAASKRNFSSSSFSDDDPLPAALLPRPRRLRRHFLIRERTSHAWTMPKAPGSRGADISLMRPRERCRDVPQRIANLGDATFENDGAERIQAERGEKRLNASGVVVIEIMRRSPTSQPAALIVTARP